MEPGRELDDLVQEHVFGFQPCEPDSAYNYHISGDITGIRVYGLCRYCGASISGKPGRCANARKPWSTEIAAALDLVPIVLGAIKGDLDKRGFDLIFMAEYALDWWDENQTNRGPRWWAHFGRYEDCGETTWAHEAESRHGLPHAICLAALRAKGVEVE